MRHDESTSSGSPRVGTYESRNREPRAVADGREPTPLAIAPASVGAAIIGGVLLGALAGPLGALVGVLAGGAAGQILDHLAARSGESSVTP